MKVQTSGSEKLLLQQLQRKNDRIIMDFHFITSEIEAVFIQKEVMLMDSIPC